MNSSPDADGMVRNDQRRAGPADAALRVLAREGIRGLAHRAVDAEAGAPVGTPRTTSATGRP